MKRLLSLVLALMMFLPVLATAESEVGLIGGADGPTQIVVMNETPRTRFQNALDAGRRVYQTVTLTELTGVQTGDATTDAAIADLVQALGMSFASQGDEINMALTLSGKDLITLGGALSGEDFYLSSNMMGGTVVVGKDEFEPLVDRLLGVLVAMGTVGVEEAATLRSQVAAFMDALADAELNQVVEAQAIAEMDFSALEAILPMMMRKITAVENIVVPRMCDPAVSGLQLVLTNEDIYAVLKQSIQFMLDNPILLEKMAESAGYPTESQLAAQWEAGGQLYMAFGIYESKEAFFASQETVESILREAMNDPAVTEILGGDMTVTLYLDEQDQLVYITASMPVITEDAQSETRTTVTINMDYTRQTVAQGVAHVCNIFVDDEAVTIDALVNDGSVSVTVIGAEPEGEPVKLLELSITEAVNAVYPAVTDIDVVATAYDGENAVLDFVYDGEYEFSDARDYVKGKLTLTACVDFDDGLSAVPTAVVLDFGTDTAFSGVDYTTDATFTVEASGLRFGMKMTEETADPQPSIMAGDMVRPAELNDADFSNWFNGVINTFELWAAEAIQALPESVLMLLLYSGMM